MRVDYSERFLTSLENAPASVQKSFYKQVKFLLVDIRHPSLHAKKYNEVKGIWQARVTRDWRFYFSIHQDIYRLHDIIPHPK